MSSDLFSEQVASTSPRQSCSGGVFSLRSGGDDLTAVKELDLPYVSGLSARFRWSETEPEPGKYDFTLLERARDICVAKHKLLMVRVTAGMYSPSWLYEKGVPSVCFGSDEVGGGWMKQGAEGRMPVPWDSQYLDRWAAFLKVLGEKIKDWPGLYCVQMTGGGFIGEMHLPTRTEPTNTQWKKFGISDEKLVPMWQRIITTYDQTMPPNVGIALDLGTPFKVPKSQTPQLVYDWAREKFPGRVWFQQNGLKEKYPAESNWSTKIREASATTIGGYQMVGGGKFLDKETGDRRKAFERAIEDRCLYVEVYRGDLLDPKWEKAVQFLAEGLRKNVRDRTIHATQPVP